MRQENLFALFRRFEHGQTDFQRRRAPAPVVKHGALVNHGIVKLFYFSFTPPAPGGEQNLALLGLAVYAQPIRRLANIALFATDQSETEKRLFTLPRPDMAEFALALAAEAHPFFELFFLFRCAHLAQFFSDIEVGIRCSMLPAFADPTE